MPRDLLPDVPNVGAKQPRDLLPNVADVVQPQIGQPQQRGLLTRLAQNPITNFVLGAGTGAARTIGDVLRTGLRDIPTAARAATLGVEVPGEERALQAITPALQRAASTIGGRQAATRQALGPLGISGTAGQIAGGIAPFIAAAPLAPEALAVESGPALAARLAGAATVGATQAPRHQALGAALGLGGGALGEAVPAILAAGKRTVQGIASSALAKPVREEIKAVFGDLHKGIDPGTLNAEVFDRMKQAYQEVKGTKLVGNSEVPLKGGVNDSEYINRDPATSVRNLFATAARLGDQNITTYDRSAWDKELNSQIKANNADLKRAPSNKNALEVKEELQNLKGGHIVKKKVIKGTSLNNFDDAKELRQDLNEMWARGHALPGISAGNPKLTKIVGPLKKAVDQSMIDSASGDPATLRALTAANNTFKNELIPYQKIGNKSSPFIKRLTGEIPSSDKLVESYVKKGEPENLRTFLGQLPDQDARDLVTAQVFKGKEDNPRSFITQYSKLGNNEKQLLFPNHKPRLDQLETLFKQHPSAFPTDILEPRGLRESVAKGLGVGLSGFGLERLVAGQPLQALALASPIIARQGIREIASIPSVRERLFQSLIRQTAQIPRRARIASTLVPGGLGGQIANQLTGGQ